MLDEMQGVVHIIYEAFILILSLYKCLCVGGYFIRRGTEPQQIQVFVLFLLLGVVSRNLPKFRQRKLLPR